MRRLKMVARTSHGAMIESRRNKRVVVLRKLLRTILWISGSLALVAAFGAAVLYQAWRHEPEFYTKALATPPKQYEEAGDQLEKNVLELRNDVRRDGRWEVEFTEKQINGWLASDLRKDFSDLLPRTIQEPRVSIAADRALLAFRFDDGKKNAVITLSVDIQLTEDPNVVAVRIRGASAGSIPLPLNQFVDRLTKTARTSEVELRWVQEQGDPVALVQVPIKHEAYDSRELKLDRIELAEGRVTIAGRSGLDVAADFFAGSSLEDHFSSSELPIRHASQDASD